MIVYHHALKSLWTTICVWLGGENQCFGGFGSIQNSFSTSWNIKVRYKYLIEIYFLLENEQTKWNIDLVIWERKQAKNFKRLVILLAIHFCALF